jgi:hypothetical protein
MNDVIYHSSLLCDASYMTHDTWYMTHASLSQVYITYLSHVPLGIYIIDAQCLCYGNKDRIFHNSVVMQKDHYNMLRHRKLKTSSWLHVLWGTCMWNKPCQWHYSIIVDELRAFLECLMATVYMSQSQYASDWGTGLHGSKIVGLNPCAAGYCDLGHIPWHV